MRRERGNRDNESIYRKNKMAKERGWGLEIVHENKKRG
jgi:hypothetical protein